MGTFLGIDFGGVIGGTTAQVVYELTLTRRTTGAINPAAIAAGVAVTSATYAATGYSSDYTVSTRDGTRVLDGHRRVTVYPSDALVAAGIEPEPDDVIVIKGPRGDERLIVELVEERAPSGALYRMKARRA